MGASCGVMVCKQNIDNEFDSLCVVSTSDFEILLVNNINNLNQCFLNFFCRGTL